MECLYECLGTKRPLGWDWGRVKRGPGGDERILKTNFNDTVYLGQLPLCNPHYSTRLRHVLGQHYAT